MTHPRYLAQLVLIMICLSSAHQLKAQDTSQNGRNVFYYRLTMAGGIGTAVPKTTGNSLGSYLEFAVQKGYVSYALGGRQLIEFDIFQNTNVENSISSVDLTIGKAYSKKRFHSTVSAGLGWVTGISRGNFISREGGWLFGYSTYEKIRDNTIGIPITCKAFWIPARFYGIGIEVYANLNLKNSFFGINMAHQLGKLRAPGETTGRVFK